MRARIFAGELRETLPSGEGVGAALAEHRGQVAASGLKPPARPHFAMRLVVPGMSYAASRNTHASRRNAPALMRSVRTQCVFRIFASQGLCDPRGSLLSFACHGPQNSAVSTSERAWQRNTPQTAHPGEAGG